MWKYAGYPPSVSVEVPKVDESIFPFCPPYHHAATSYPVSSDWSQHPRSTRMSVTDSLPLQRYPHVMNGINGPTAPQYTYLVFYSNVVDGQMWCPVSLHLTISTRLQCNL